MDFTITVTGTEHCIKTIEKIEQVIQSDNLKKYIAEKAIAVINRNAREKLEKNENYINHNKYNIKSNGIEIYNDVTNEQGVHYSLIVEYGSGIYAEKGHIGTSEEFINSNYQWWYGFCKKIKVHGQTPKHIYEDSAKIIERNLHRWVNEYLRKFLGGR